MPQTNKEKKAAYDKEYYIENKEAISARVKLYQENNKEKRSAKAKEWRKKNKEAIKQYYENNKEQINTKSKEWYENNKEKVAAQQKEYNEKNKEKIAAQQKEYREVNKVLIADMHRMARYGITPDSFKRMLKEQNNKCKICLVEFDELIPNQKINVDHCHTTNQVRGLLCSLCNRGLGHFKDNTKTLTKAINYLQENT